MITDEGKEPETRRLIIPYVFYTETLATTVGVGAGTTVGERHQGNLLATGFGTSNGSAFGAVLARDLGVPKISRLFVDMTSYYGYFREQRLYRDGNPGFPGELAGSNGSSENNFLEAPGKDGAFELDFKYVPPVGAARLDPVTRFELDRGMLASEPLGGDRWNPLAGGRTILQAGFFYRNQGFEFNSGDTSLRTNGVQLEAEYDNRDFPVNPSAGSHSKLTFDRDFGWFDSSGSWTTVKLSLAKYFSLGEAPGIRQQVLAVNLWTGDTPSWDEVPTAGGVVIDGRPPPYRSVYLGGFDRLRAYPFYRFNDRAAVHYAAEYRLVPDWNPLEKFPYLKVDWLQFVAYAELGRVAGNYDLEELHRDMKYDLGVGLRALVEKALLRVDFAAANADTFNVWAMVTHPF